MKTEQINEQEEKVESNESPIKKLRRMSRKRELAKLGLEENATQEEVDKAIKLRDESIDAKSKQRVKRLKINETSGCPVGVQYSITEFIPSEFYEYKDLLLCQIREALHMAWIKGVLNSMDILAGMKEVDLDMLSKFYERASQYNDYEYFDADRKTSEIADMANKTNFTTSGHGLKADYENYKQFEH